MKLSKAVVASRKNEHGEWVVRAYDENGKRYPAADYFTTDRNDAVGTAAAMMNPNT